MWNQFSLSTPCVSTGATIFLQKSQVLGCPIYSGISSSHLTGFLSPRLVGGVRCKNCGQSPCFQWSLSMAMTWVCWPWAKCSGHWAISQLTFHGLPYVCGTSKLLSLHGSMVLPSFWAALCFQARKSSYLCKLCLWTVDAIRNCSVLLAMILIDGDAWQFTISSLVALRFAKPSFSYVIIPFQFKTY